MTYEATIEFRCLPQYGIEPHRRVIDVTVADTARPWPEAERCAQHELRKRCYPEGSTVRVLRVLPIVPPMVQQLELPLGWQE